MAKGIIQQRQFKYNGESLIALPDRALVLEIGWVVAGKLESPDRAAVVRARDATLACLTTVLPQFQFQMPLLEREELVRGLQIEPVKLLDAGVVERNIRRWDFTVLITAADLISHYRHDAFAAISRALEGAVISTSRIDPRAVRTEASEEERVEAMARRIKNLALHAIGHLLGLGHDDRATNFMCNFDTLADLDALSDYSDEQLELLEENVRAIADWRLEEAGRRFSTWQFYLQSIWINRREVLRAIWLARPWQFPYRLSRLTTAAVSAMMILMVTAEVWDLGLEQPIQLVIGLSLFSLCANTFYVVSRQRLFMRRGESALSEQVVVTNVSTVAIVLSGMLTTYLVLVSISLLVGLLIFQGSLVAEWAAITDEAIRLSHYVKLAAFVASLALFIGALGASFEQQQYFRHITFVDEEI